MREIILLLVCIFIKIPCVIFMFIANIFGFLASQLAESGLFILNKFVFKEDDGGSDRD